MKGFDPRWKDLPDYIIGITKEIWEDRGIATLHRYYTPDLAVRSPTALVVGNAVLTRVARSRTEPAWSTHFRPNSWMAAAFVVPLLLCALLVAVPGLRDAFGLTVLPASGLLLAILLGAVSALAYEPFKRAG